MPFVAFMAKWLTTARGVRRTRPLSSISRCTTTLGNRCAPKKRVGSVTPAQDDGRETCHLILDVGGGSSSVRRRYELGDKSVGSLSCSPAGGWRWFSVPDKGILLSSA